MTDARTRVQALAPTAQCLHVPMSTAVAIYVDGRMIGSESSDTHGAWLSALRILLQRNGLEM